MQPARRGGRRRRGGGAGRAWGLWEWLREEAVRAAEGWAILGAFTLHY